MNRKTVRWLALATAFGTSACAASDHGSGTAGEVLLDEAAANERTYCGCSDPALRTLCLDHLRAFLASPAAACVIEAANAASEADRSCLQLNNEANKTCLENSATCSESELDACPERLAATCQLSESYQRAIDLCHNRDSAPTTEGRCSPSPAGCQGLDESRCAGVCTYREPCVGTLACGELNAEECALTPGCTSQPAACQIVPQWAEEDCPRATAPYPCEKLRGCSWQPAP